MSVPMTEGAKRSLALAARIAKAAGADCAAAVHLLWALWLDDSHAAEIMQQHGISRSVLEAELPLPASVAVNDLSGHEDDLSGHETEGREPVASALGLEEIVQQAQHLVRLAGPTAELGTEHLLLGILRVEAQSDADSHVGRFLIDAGFDAERLAEDVAEQAGSGTQPLRMDATIRWQDADIAEQNRHRLVLESAAARTVDSLAAAAALLPHVVTTNARQLTRELTGLKDTITAALRREGFVAAYDDHAPHPARTPSQRSLNNERLGLGSRPVSLDQTLDGALGDASAGLTTLIAVASQKHPELARQAEQCRRRLAAVRRALHVCLSSRKRLEEVDLCLLVTESLCHHGAGPAVRAALEAGVGMIQLREKTMCDRELLNRARWMRRVTREAGALLIINDRPDLAVLADADGVHVGQEDLCVAETRRIVGPKRLIGVSTHSIEQARQAVLDGADYLGVGPVFPTKTKQFASLAGLEFVRQVAAEIALPWFAIGGISAKNVAQVVEAGATRIAVSSAICSASDPLHASRELCDRLHECRNAKTPSAEHDMEHDERGGGE